MLPIRKAIREVLSLDAQTATDRFVTILKENAFHEEDGDTRFWRAVIIPIHYGLSGYLPGDRFDQCLDHFKSEGYFSDVHLSPGEPHADDDVFYIRFSDAGIRWLDLKEDAEPRSFIEPTTGI